MNIVIYHFVLMFGRGCLRNTCMAKSQRQINFMFHPIDKDERLLSFASDIEVLSSGVERDCLGKITKFPRI